jgi:hypothetical protein
MSNYDFYYFAMGKIDAEPILGMKNNIHIFSLSCESVKMSDKYQILKKPISSGWLRETNESERSASARLIFHANLHYAAHLL